MPQRRSEQSWLAAWYAWLKSDPGRRALRLAGLAFLAGAIIGLVVFGWWLTPVPFGEASLEQLDKAERDAFLLALADLYAETRDIEPIRAALSDWPTAVNAICLASAERAAAEPADMVAALNLGALATALNDEGCMRVVGPPSEASRTAPHIGNVLMVVGLVAILGLVGYGILITNRRLAAARQADEAARALSAAPGETEVGSLRQFLATPFVVFLVRRILAIPVTLLIITAALYGIIMFAPAEERASLHLPPRLPSRVTAEQIQQFLDRVIAEQGLDDPYPIQYIRWVGNLLQGQWGWSPILRADVLEALRRRTPPTLELTFYSLLFFIPLGLFSGVMAGWRENSGADHRFRFLAFLGTSIPPFVLGLFLLSLLYVRLGWFPPGRTAIIEISLQSSTFKAYTGFLTLDGLLNGRLDVTYDALRHLILPVFALSLAHWATLGRVTRASIIDVKDQNYITAARARGVSSRGVMWRHGFRVAMVPGLTSTALSAAALITSVFVIEVVFNIHGLSELVIMGMQGTPDAALALGFAVYTTLLVLPIMLILDIIKAIVDPRIREEGL